jgi:hypothetical protein
MDGLLSILAIKCRNSHCDVGIHLIDVSPCLELAVWFVDLKIRIIYLFILLTNSQKKIF